LEGTNSSTFITSVNSAVIILNEEGRACSMHAREEMSVQGFGGKARRKETTQKAEA
jgi:hypothetical protein